VDTVDRLAAAVEDPGTADLLRDPLVHLEQEVPVCLRSAQVARRVVGPHDRVGAGLELRPGRHDAGGQEGVQVPAHPILIKGDVDQEVLQAHHLIGDRPRPVDLADDGDVGVSRPKQPDRAGDCRQGRSPEVVVGDRDLVRLVDHVLRRGGPVGLARPVRVAAEGIRLELRVEHRHDRVQPEDVVGCRGEAGHQLPVEVGLREWRLDQVHHLRGHHGAQGARRDLVDSAAVDGRQHPPARRHPLASEWTRDLSKHARTPAPGTTGDNAARRRSRLETTPGPMVDQPQRSVAIVAPIQGAAAMLPTVVAAEPARSRGPRGADPQSLRIRRPR
jgi:hypothetical protein